MSITEEIKESFKKGTNLIKLIYINLSVFVIVKTIHVIFFLFNGADISDYFFKNILAVPAYLPNLLIKPWTIISYMFFHWDFWHILFNLIWLYWFGNVFLQYFSQKQITAIYILGGVSGAILYILAYNLFPVFSLALPESTALGASAAVMAIAIAISFYVPDYTFNLMFIGQIKIKYIALFFIFTDIITMADGNAGGHIAHLGGALLGYIFAIQFKKGKDITKRVNVLFDSIASLFKAKPKFKVNYTNTPVNDLDYNKQKKKNQEEIDKILDKISKNGYESLTKNEKEILFKAGK